MVDMTALTEICGWEMSENDRTHVTFELMGYVLSVDMPGHLLERFGTGDTYFQTYESRVGENAVETGQGDIMYEQGRWYMAGSFLEKALKAECVFEEDEQVLILKIVDAGLADSVD